MVEIGVLVILVEPAVFIAFVVRVACIRRTATPYTRTFVSTFPSSWTIGHSRPLSHRVVVSIGEVGHVLIPSPLAVLETGFIFRVIVHRSHEFIFFIVIVIVIVIIIRRRRRLGPPRRRVIGSRTHAREEQ